MSNLKTEFANIQILMSSSDEESDRVSVDSTHTQGACGGESVDSPAASVFHFPTIDAEYVFVPPNIVTLFDITLMNVYLVITRR